MEDKLYSPLEGLKAANMRLRLAINKTIANWPNVTRCWIDQINEPTVLLADHLLVPEPIMMKKSGTE